MIPGFALPDRHELLAAYYVLGGIAAGAAVIARLAARSGDHELRGVARGADFVAFPLALGCAGILRFARESPGSQGLIIFIGFSASAFLAAVLESRGGALADRVGRFRGCFAGRTLGIAGLLAACFFGGDAGILMVPMGLPVWPETTWIGPLFLASAVSLGAAALIVLPGEPTARERLAAIQRWAIVLVLVLLAAFATALGPGVVPLAFSRWPGVLVPAFVVPFGVVLPLVSGTLFGPNWSRASAWLVLVGGLALRWAVIALPEALLNPIY